MDEEDFPTMCGDSLAFERLYNELLVAAQEYRSLRDVALKLYQLGWEKGHEHGQME